MPEVDLTTFHHAIDLMKQMYTDNTQHSTTTYPFTPYTARNHSYTIGAIDGSHHNLPAAHFVFSTIRAGYQLFREGKIVKEVVSPVKVELLTKANFKERHAAYFYAITGDKPTGLMEFEKCSERIRTLLEWENVSRLVNELSGGDIILLDGSMISGVISTHKLFFEELVYRAKEKGITLAGLSKDTSLMIGTTSAVRVYQQASERQLPASNWYVPHEDTYFVRFHGGSDLIFRLDLILPDGISPEEAIQKLSAYCYDEAMTGFPFPMQTIHDAVRISGQDVQECLHLFKSTCQKEQVPLAFVDDLFTIYHTQLDRLSAGR